MAVYLALDAGTTSCRAVAYDAGDGRVVGRGQHEFAQHFPGDGLVEHDADEIFGVQVGAAREALAAAGDPPVRAVGITNQRETVVVFERATGRPIHRAIVWQDRRTAAVLARLAAGGAGDRVRALTGLPLDPYFSAAKIAAILDAVPGARAAAARGELAAVTVDAWLTWKLTGGAVLATEPSNAARTSLFDIHRGEWSDELLALFDVPRAVLPEVRDSAGDFGSCRPDLLGGAWPIRGVLGDQQAALLGHGAVHPGDSKCTYGTGAFFLCHAGEAPPPASDGLLATVAWRVAGTTHYALEGSVLVSGAAVQWLRDGLGVIASADEVEALARGVADSGGVVLVPAFAGLGTPDWDPTARGLLIGITRGTTRAHLARATLEAMACQVRDVQLAIERSLGRRIASLRVDGGAAENRLLLELQAALSGVVVERPLDLETTALGALRIAQVGVGDLQLDACPAGAIDLRVAPPDGVDGAGTWRRWRRAVERAKGWARPAAD